MSRTVWDARKYLSGAAQATVDTHPPLLIALSEHDNNLDLLLQDHLPEVISSFRQWPLGGDVLLGRIVALKEQ